MFRKDFDDYIFFEKIRRRKNKFDDENDKRRKKFSDQEIILMDSQVFGSIHTIKNAKLIDFKNNKIHDKDYYKINKIRPGVVITSPSEETNYETEWIPMTSKILFRNPNTSVLLLKFFENVRVDSVLLLKYRYWLKFNSLSERKGMLSYQKQIELRKKLDQIQQVEFQNLNENLRY